MTISNRPVALVTGGAKRIGRALCLALAQANFNVAVHYGTSVDEAHQLVRELEQFGVKACAMQADLNDEAAVRGLIPRVAAELGAVSVLINNASLFEYDALTQDAPLSATHFERHLRINTYAPLALMQQLDRTQAGVVINLLDQKLHNPNPDFLSYTLSKAALEHATQLAAIALAPNIRVVGVALGLTLSSHMMDETRFEQLHQLSPLGRSSALADVVSTVLFAIHNASITGTTLVVDGGQHLMRFERDFSVMP